MNLTLPYGRRMLDIELPEQTDVIQPAFLSGLPDEAGSIRNALEQPIDSHPLRALVPRGATVGIVVCDVTRPFPAARVLPAVLEQLDQSDITIFVATGTHRRCTDQELDRILGRAVLSRCHVVQHDAFDAGQHVLLGRLADTGTPALVHRGFLECDVKITTGFIEPHFFAGFSGGPKMVAPGLAAIETVLDLHSAIRIGNPKAIWGITVGNPVHDAVREIAALADVTFNVDVTLNRDHAITGVFAGEMFASHAAGCEFVKRTAMVPVRERYDVVVTSNSGYPLDQNLYQSVKGMSAAAQIVEQGGTIVIAAECSDGLPEHGMYKDLLKRARSPENFIRLLAQPDFKAHDQWQVQIQAQIQRRARVFVKADGLNDEQLRGAWFEPVQDITSLVSSLSGTVAALPHGPQTIPYVA